jgi:Ni,Fe-hydrogenase III large subunit
MKQQLVQFKAEYFKALAHPLRISIVDTLRDGELTVNEISQKFEIEPTNASQQLAVLRHTNIVDADVRRDHPFAAYGQLNFRVPVFKEADVWARMTVRVQEVQESARLIGQSLDAMPFGPMVKPIQHLSTGSCGFGLVEGWRGPIWYWVVAGADGRPERVKIKDPSFSNWPALSYAILKNIVPDFPLINKSFNLSYAGNDL